MANPRVKASREHLESIPGRDAEREAKLTEMWYDLQELLVAWVSKSLPGLPVAKDAGQIKAALDAISMIQRLRPADLEAPPGTGTDHKDIDTALGRLSGLIPPNAPPTSSVPADTGAQ